MRRRLLRAYDALFRAFGPQHWWPGDTAFEMMAGAILTQNTNWGNVERAIANLKAAGALDPRRMARLSERRLAALIRPSGTFRVKARRLRAFVLWLNSAAERQKRTEAVPAGPLSVSLASVRQDIPSFRGVPTDRLRRELLRVHGIGPETADSILLYALRRRKFVVDAYTRRFLSRHGLIEPGASYAEIQSLFEQGLPPSRRLYNEYHALIDRLGKEYCRTRPRCDLCPLNPLLGPVQRPAVRAPSRLEWRRIANRG
jgi:endonuclease III related protein